MKTRLLIIMGILISLGFMGVAFATHDPNDPIMHSIIPHDLKEERIIPDLEKDSGTVTLRNQTYYFETPNYTETAYVDPVQISFHDVVFTLFPSGFRGGLPTGGCGGSYFWTDVLFQDKVHEILHVFGNSSPCIVDSIPTMFSDHANPRAGLIFYDEKMKLLVSMDTTNATLQSGKDIEVNYKDFRNASGEIIEVDCGVGLRASPDDSFGNDVILFFKCNPSLTLILVLVIGITVGIIFIVWRKRKSSN